MTLEGIRILVTRAAHQAAELADPLRTLGGNVILLPMIGIAKPADIKPLRAAAARSEQYDWIVFTSANAVTAFAEQQPRLLAPVATVGEATRMAAERLGWTVQLTPENHIAESLAALFEQQDIHGKRILIPAAAVTRDVLGPALRRQGAVVDIVEAYRNVVPAGAADQARRLFENSSPDWVTFASSSAAINLIDAVAADDLGRSKIASIGPATSVTIRGRGFEVAAEASHHTVEGLVECLVYAAGS